MAAPKRVTIEVNVINDPSKPGRVWFELGYKHVFSGQKLKFQNEDHPGFWVHFNIVDDIGSGCTFLPNLLDAMWVEPISSTPPYSCPTAPVHWGEFQATGYGGNVNHPDYTTLVVRNFKDTPTLFAFTLRFHKPGWPTPIDYDPIGDNQNGPRTFSNLK